jgi:hypothetical protein
MRLVGSPNVARCLSSIRENFLVRMVNLSVDIIKLARITDYSNHALPFPPRNPCEP